LLIPAGELQSFERPDGRGETYTHKKRPEGLIQTFFWETITCNLPYPWWYCNLRVNCF
jgi:hypothetical protein